MHPEQNYPQCIIHDLVHASEGILASILRRLLGSYVCIQNLWFHHCTFMQNCSSVVEMHNALYTSHPIYKPHAVHLSIVHCDTRVESKPILGSFRLQSTCRYQRSREDVCPQHKATGHVSKYVNSRCAIENCLMSARNIRATAHAPCSQHTFNRNLELKTDQFHGVYRLVTPST